MGIVNCSDLFLEKEGVNMNASPVTIKYIYCVSLDVVN